MAVSRMKVTAMGVVQSDDKGVLFAGKEASFLWCAGRRVLVSGIFIVFRHFRGREQCIQRLQPECLRLKDAAEVAGHLLSQIIKRGYFTAATEGALSHLLLKRRHRLVCNPAGDDQLEIIEIGVHVEGK